MQTLQHCCQKIDMSHAIPATVDSILLNADIVASSLHTAQCILCFHA